MKKYVPVPPTVNVPKGMDVLKGENLDLYCHATSNDGSSLSYLWYETPTGAMQDIVAINRGTETGDTLRVDTSTPEGKQYFHDHPEIKENVCFPMVDWSAETMKEILSAQK